MKMKTGEIFITIGVVILAVLMTAELSQARMGDRGHGGSSGGGISGGSGMGGHDSNGVGDRMDSARDRDREKMHTSGGSFDGPYRSVSTGGFSNGGVLMVLRPEGIINGKFHIRYSAETRSGDLGDYDLQQQCTLEYGGKVIHPAQADHMSGDYAEGSMIFDLDEMPEHFRVIINEIPGEDHRVHSW